MAKKIREFIVRARVTTIKDFIVEALSAEEATILFNAGSGAEIEEKETLDWEIKSVKENK